MDYYWTPASITPSIMDDGDSSEIELLIACPVSHFYNIMPACWYNIDDGYGSQQIEDMSKIVLIAWRYQVEPAGCGDEIQWHPDSPASDRKFPCRGSGSTMKTAGEWETN
jgi:hypothetical protein